MLKMNQKYFIAKLVASLTFWAQSRGSSCTFDPASGPLARSAPNYYHILPNNNVDVVDYISASVTSNNGCN